MTHTEYLALKRIIKHLSFARNAADEIELTTSNGGFVGSLVGTIMDELELRVERHLVEVSFGKRGTSTFATHEEAEKYLIAMPVGYAGAARQQQYTGKWVVSYRRIAA